MISAQFTRGDQDDRIKQLAGEVAIRAMQDIKLLQRRGVLDGLRLTKNQIGKLSDCNCYRDVKEVRSLVRDVKNGTVLFWCKVAGVRIDQATLNRVIKRGIGNVN
jgi:hypothetical protein